jgi:hypothetical protein
MNRDETFNNQLAVEVGRNRDAIADFLGKSKVGQCSGKCTGFGGYSDKEWELWNGNRRR